MKVTINAEPVEVDIEAEGTALDLLSGINETLLESDMLMTDFDIDGKGASGFSDVDLSALSAAGVGRVEVRASAFADVASILVSEARETAEALRDILPALEDTAVSLQTGKDKEALDAIRVFSEKVAASTRIFSIVRQIRKADRLPLIGASSVPEFFDSMNAVLLELEEAFKAKDSVLLGDIAEYEIAPRLRDLIDTLESLGEGGSS
jgi:hypothetical protein